MVNEAPKTIASFARNRLCARLLSVGLREVIGGLFCCYKSLQTFVTEVRVVGMVNEAPKTIVSFARNRKCARLLSVGLREVFP